MAWFKEDRTEPATPKRRTEARKKGQVAKSREIPTAIIILVASTILYLYGYYLNNTLIAFSRQFWAHANSMHVSPLYLDHAGRYILQALSWALSPLFIGLIFVCLLTNYIQTGFILSADPITPRLSRINPISGLGRLFSLSAFVELLKSILKLFVIAYITYRIIIRELPHLPALSTLSINQIISYMVRISFNICIKVGLVLFIIACLDYLYQRYQYEQNLRMTKQEVKEEYREREGDPKIKARIRSLQRQIARRRMMQAVPKADVVITNPIRLAVALKYEHKKMVAPEVVAKGAGLLAERIKQIARAHNITIVENEWLAQILYKTVEVGQTIPPTLYKAVAEILAYVYRLKGKRL